jgi:hypothetical protein
MTRKTTNVANKIRRIQDLGRIFSRGMDASSGQEQQVV